VEKRLAKNLREGHLEGEVCLAAGPLAVEDGGMILTHLRAHLTILKIFRSKTVFCCQKNNLHILETML